LRAEIGGARKPKTQRDPGPEPKTMKFAMMGAVLITLPAIVALIYSLIAGNHVLTYAALFSLGLNTLPFLAAGLLMRGNKTDLEH
jgi:hypothetical protein